MWDQEHASRNPTQRFPASLPHHTAISAQPGLRPRSSGSFSRARRSKELYSRGLDDSPSSLLSLIKIQHSYFQSGSSCAWARLSRHLWAEHNKRPRPGRGDGGRAGTADRLPSGAWCCLRLGALTAGPPWNAPSLLWASSAFGNTLTNTPAPPDNFDCTVMTAVGLTDLSHPSVPQSPGCSHTTQPHVKSSVWPPWEAGPLRRVLRWGGGRLCHRQHLPVRGGCGDAPRPARPPPAPAQELAPSPEPS